MTENDRRPPAHVRRAKLARRAQLILALAAAGFAVYRLMAVFTHHGAFMR